MRLPLSMSAIGGQIDTLLRERYRVTDGRDGDTSEAGHAYNLYSTQVALAVESPQSVLAARLRRAMDELLDSLAGETRHGLLVLRRGGCTSQNLSEDSDSPVVRLRLTVRCHGSSYEEWQASLRKIEEQRL